MRHGSTGWGGTRRVCLVGRQSLCWARVTLSSFLILGFLLVGSVAGAQDRSAVLVAEVDGPITPVIVDYLTDGIRTAEDAGHVAFVVELDTPGGLDASMRDIVQEFLGASVPVVVYVAPPGGRAASAGTFITMAAHVASMAPGTTIGAATPVDLQGGEISDKVLEDAASFAESVAGFHGRDIDFAVEAVRQGRSITADEAVERGVVDLIARDLNMLLEMIDGRTVRMADGSDVTLYTGGAGIETYDPGFFRSVLMLLADPNLAFLFLSLGTLAIFYELANPGLGLAGIIGVILLIVGFFALSVLPVNAAGVALLILAVGLFIGELFVSGIGVLGAGGTIALLLGGLFLFEGPFGVSGTVLWPTGVVVGAGVVLAARLTWRARRAPSTSGLESLIGRETVIRSADGSSGQALVEGAWWRVRSRRGNLTEGQTVTVVASDGLELVVDSKEASDE